MSRKFAKVFHVEHSQNGISLIDRDLCRCEEFYSHWISPWYILTVYIAEAEFKMSKTETARLFQNGRSQAVRLPREFRFEGERVRIRRVSDGVLLQPLIDDPAEWFARLDEATSEPLVSDRRQPSTPKRKLFQ
jgi:antitoxin VapB